MKKISCRVCGCTRQKIILKDYRALNRSWDLVKCLNCGLVSTEPLPDEEILAFKYTGDYWAASSDPAAAVMYNLRMKAFARRLCKALPHGCKALDVGAGNGLWVNLLKANGFDATGIDPYAPDTAKTAVFKCSLQKAPFEKKSFDLITFLHVLEHMENPADSLKEADRFLKPGGLLVIEVPNIESMGFRLFKTKWFPLEDIPSHINHFSKTSLLFTVKNAGNYSLIMDRGFSLKDSPSILVNTIFPDLSPRSVRNKYSGRHPACLKASYLLCQGLVLPFAWIVAKAGHGEVVRMVFKKNVKEE
jgi:SAM-dependent methyltransferase